MPIFHLSFYGKELKVVRSLRNTSLYLDDLARALGHDIGSELDPVVSSLKLTDHTYPVPIMPRGSVTMITLAAAKRVAESYFSTKGSELAQLLDETFNEFDHIRYNGLPQSDIEKLRISKAVGRILENHPDATPERIAEQLAIAPEEASFYLRHQKAVQSFGQALGVNLG